MSNGDQPPESSLRARQLPKASDLLAEDIRARIIGEAMRPGAPLPSEGELIRDLGLSRATVREALRLLEADGLIAIKRGPGGGIVVRHPEGMQLTRSLALLLALNDAPLRDLFEFRKVLEPAAAGAAAANATAAQRKVLQAIAESGGAGSSRVDFHVLIAQLSGNVLYRLNLGVLHDVIQWHVSGESLSDRDIAETDAAHRKIASAIASGDSRAAERAMLRHLETFEQRMDEADRLDKPILPRSRWLERQRVLRDPAVAGGAATRW